jgi:hypothetical protein
MKSVTAALLLPLMPLTLLLAPDTGRRLRLCCCCCKLAAAVEYADVLRDGSSVCPAECVTNLCAHQRLSCVQHGDGSVKMRQLAWSETV